jgi:ADP-heptose:LPS heptosyltransferase
LIETTDADFISLQYKDPTAEIEASGLPVKHYRRACQTDDYDDLAGLVAELDMVIGIHTAALHLAGGLGIKTFALVPSKPSWAYYGAEMPWYPETYQLHKQKDGEKWADTIRRIDLGNR